jgi:hypothetical protein
MGILWAVALLLAAAPSSATLFSFGTIDATDVITSISLASDDGMGGNTFEFDTSTNTLTITSSVTQINFANKGPIAGIPIGDVIFSTQLQLNGAYSFVLPVNPTQTTANFINGLTDFTITDIAGGAVSVLEADFDGLGLEVQTRVLTGVLLGELSGAFTITGGDADAVAAFGNDGGTIDQVFSIMTVPLGGNLCNRTVICSAITSGVATDWKTFEANPTSTLLRTLVVSEPYAAALLLLATAPLAARFRRR